MRLLYKAQTLNQISSLEAAISKISLLLVESRMQRSLPKKANICLEVEIRT